MSYNYLITVSTSLILTFFLFLDPAGHSNPYLIYMECQKAMCLNRQGPKKIHFSYLLILERRVGHTLYLYGVAALFKQKSYRPIINNIVHKFLGKVIIFFCYEMTYFSLLKYYEQVAGKYTPQCTTDKFYICWLCDIFMESFYQIIFLVQQG